MNNWGYVLVLLLLVGFVGCIEASYLQSETNIESEVGSGGYEVYRVEVVDEPGESEFLCLYTRGNQSFSLLVFDDEHELEKYKKATQDQSWYHPNGTRKFKASGPSSWNISNSYFREGAILPGELYFVVDNTDYRGRYMLGATPNGSGLSYELHIYVNHRRCGEIGERHSDIRDEYFNR